MVELKAGLRVDSMVAWMVVKRVEMWVEKMVVLRAEM